MPLQRRVPKFGFTNINRVEYHGINLDTLQKLVDAKIATDNVNIEMLRENGLLGKKQKVKILGRGELNAKLTVEADKFSKTAKEAIEAKGGEAKALED